VSDQLEFMESLKGYYHQIPFGKRAKPDVRYYFENDQFSYSDAIILYSMLRYLAPARIIEVGSGFSSAAMLDTKDFFLNPNTEITFIEPYPERLRSLLKENDTRYQIIEAPVQTLNSEIFSVLAAGDVLFIDSTHVAKTGSDVNYLFFEVLPKIKPGVYVHVHDVFPNFEYPEQWVMQGRSWNEDYLLRAFLMFNSDFEIVLMNSWLAEVATSWFRKNMPLCLKNPGGSLWLRRL
jgi:predicted O-methyltransferase YrrM